MIVRDYNFTSSCQEFDVAVMFAGRDRFEFVVHNYLEIEESRDQYHCEKRRSYYEERYFVDRIFGAVGLHGENIAFDISNW